MSETRAAYFFRDDKGMVSVTVYNNGSQLFRQTMSAAGMSDDAAFPRADAVLTAGGWYPVNDWTMPEAWNGIAVDYRCDVIPGDTVVWTAGHNDAGYSPDPDHIAVFTNADDARAYVADEVSRFAEFIAEGEALENVSLADDDSLAASAGADAENIKGNADGDYSGEFSIAIDDGRPLPTIYWVHCATLAGVFDGAIDSDEYRDIIEGLTS